MGVRDHEGMMRCQECRGSRGFRGYENIDNKDQFWISMNFTLKKRDIGVL